MARYGQAYKDRIVARLLPPESSSVEHVSREVGISVATLERWRADGLANGSAAGSPRWTAAARLQAVIVAAAMDEATRSAWCREQGLYPAELDAWKRDAIAGLGEPRASSAVEARQDRRRVRELERELHRKDKSMLIDGQAVNAAASGSSELATELSAVPLPRTDLLADGSRCASSCPFSVFESDRRKIKSASISMRRSRKCGTASSSSGQTT